MRAFAGHVRLLLSGFALIWVVHALSFVVFAYEPAAFYYRAWEYFDAFPYRSRAFPPVWQRHESGDLSNRHLLLYRESWPTRVTADEDGFRSVPYEAEAYPILFNGDSAVWGSGLSDRATLPYALAEQLAVPVFNGARTPLRNALLHPRVSGAQLVIDGRSERSITRRVFTPRHRGKGYEPLIRDDLGRWSAVLAVEPMRYSPVVRLASWAGRLKADLQVARGEQEFAGALVTRHRRRESDLTAAVKAIVSRWRALAASGRRYVLVPIPSKQTLLGQGDAYTRGYLRLLFAELAKHDVDFVDLLTPFERHRGAPLYRRYDSHWTPTGSLLAAAEVARYLERRGLVPKAGN